MLSKAYILYDIKDEYPAVMAVYRSKERAEQRKSEIVSRSLQYKDMANKLAKQAGDILTKWLISVNPKDDGTYPYIWISSWKKKSDISGPLKDSYYRGDIELLMESFKWYSKQQPPEIPKIAPWPYDHPKLMDYDMNIEEVDYDDTSEAR